MSKVSLVYINASRISTCANIFPTVEAARGWKRIEGLFRRTEMEIRELCAKLYMRSPDRNEPPLTGDEEVVWGLDVRVSAKCAL